MYNIKGICITEIMESGITGIRDNAKVTNRESCITEADIMELGITKVNRYVGVS